MEDNKKIMEMKEKDILAKLMGEFETPTVTVKVKINGSDIPLTLKGLTQAEISKIRTECTYIRKISGKLEEKLNSEEFDAGLIVAATVNFNWNNPELLSFHKMSDGKQLIRKKLLGGKISNITNKIMEISEYNDELEEIEDVKNS